MASCDGFVKSWYIKSVSGHFEIVAHEIRIEELGTGEYSVTCVHHKDHTYKNATCAAGGLAGKDGYTIVLTPGKPNRIDFTAGDLLSGSWTAEDQR